MCSVQNLPGGPRATAGITNEKGRDRTARHGPVQGKLLGRLPVFSLQRSIGGIENPDGKNSREIDLLEKAAEDKG